MAATVALALVSACARVATAPPQEAVAAQPGPGTRPTESDHQFAVDIEGFGRRATGGKGGPTIAVSTAEELAAALAAPGPRTVVFARGGVYPSNLTVTSGDLTLDGSTAPEPVTLRGGTFTIRARNVIVRHLRFRESPTNRDLVVLGDGAQDVVIDHCALTWAGDEAIATDKSGAARNVTVQWSIIAEAKNCVVKADKLCGRNAVSIRNGSERWSLHHNLFLSSAKGVPPKGRGMEVVNNVIMNFTQDDSGGQEADVVSNEYVPAAGAAMTARPGHFVRANLGLAGAGEAGAPHGGNAFAVVPAGELRAHLAPRVGATLPCRDGIDARLVGEMLAGTGRMIEAVAELDWQTGCAAGGR